MSRIQQYLWKHYVDLRVGVDGVLRVASAVSVDARRCRKHPCGADDPWQEPLERDAGRAAGVD